MVVCFKIGREVAIVFSSSLFIFSSIPEKRLLEQKKSRTGHELIGWLWLSS